MPPIELTRLTWLRSVCRVLFTGLPLAGKSTGALTLPHRTRDGAETIVWGAPVQGDILFLVVPGEQGYSSIVPSDAIRVMAWEFRETLDLAHRRTVADEFHGALKAAITGQLGDVHTLVIDGMSWWYPLMMPLLGWTETDYLDKEGARKYSRFHAEFSRTFAPLMQSRIPVVAGTAYLDREPSDPDNPKSFKTGMPAFPGRMGRQDIFGMFPFLINCEREESQGKDTFTWRLAPSARVQSAGMHLPRELAALLPKQCAPDWRIIEQAVQQGLDARA